MDETIAELGQEPLRSEDIQVAQAGQDAPVAPEVQAKGELATDGADPGGDLLSAGDADPAMVDGLSSPAGPFDQALDLLQAGGPVVMILIVFSIIAMSIIIYKFLQFSMTGLGRGRNVDRAVALCRSGKIREALASVQGAKDPVSRSVALALRGRLRGDVEDAAIREEVQRFAGSQMDYLRSHLGFLELIGSLAPLLGLLGTVLGMIDAFQALEQAGRNVDPSILSGGIWAALLTTAAGLIVAIPVVAIAHWLDQIVAATTHRLEDAVTQIFTPNLNQRQEDFTNDSDAVYA